MDSKLYSYRLIFSPQVEENEFEILYVSQFLNQENIDFKMFVIYLNDKTLQTLSLLNLVTRMIF